MDSSPTTLRFRELLAAGGAHPPVDELCYLICVLAGYPVDIDAARHDLDTASQQMTPTFEGVIAALFHGTSTLRGNTDDYYRLDNSLLCEVQRTGLGIPITLSVLALEHARRLGVSMVGVGLPGHFIVASSDNGDLFADPFNGGRLLDRDGVRSLFASVTGRGDQWRDEFLAPVTGRDIVFRVLNNIKGACVRDLIHRDKLPWVMELMSWFPQGTPFDPAAAARAMALYN